MGDPRGLRRPDRLVVCLVRHGRTAHNAERRFLGKTDVPLDAVGRAQAAALGAVLDGVDAIYSSPLSRARQTAEAFGVPTLVDDLAELDQGALEGLDGPTAFARYPAFFQAFQADPTDVPAPGGESLGQLQARVGAALRGIAARHEPGQVIAVVAHQLVISAFGCLVHADGLAHWRRHAVDNASITSYRARPEPWERIANGWTVAGIPGSGV